MASLVEEATLEVHRSSVEPTATRANCSNIGATEFESRVARSLGVALAATYGSPGPVPYPGNPECDGEDPGESGQPRPASAEIVNGGRRILSYTIVVHSDRTVRRHQHSVEPQHGRLTGERSAHIVTLARLAHRARLHA